jgi:hypothetical protein
MTGTQSSRGHAAFNQQGQSDHFYLKQAVRLPLPTELFSKQNS